MSTLNEQHIKQTLAISDAADWMPGEPCFVTRAQDFPSADNVGYFPMEARILSTPFRMRASWWLVVGVQHWEAPYPLSAIHRTLEAAQEQAKRWEGAKS